MSIVKDDQTHTQDRHSQIGSGTSCYNNCFQVFWKQPFVIDIFYQLLICHTPEQIHRHREEHAGYLAIGSFLKRN